MTSRPIDPRVHRIMDLKTPSSGECARNRMENLPLLGVRDEVKFVIGSEEDYAWAKAQVLAGVPGWADRVNAILFSPVFGKMTPLESGHARDGRCVAARADAAADAQADLGAESAGGVITAFTERPNSPNQRNLSKKGHGPIPDSKVTNPVRRICPISPIPHP